MFVPEDVIYIAKSLLYTVQHNKQLIIFLRWKKILDKEIIVCTMTFAHVLLFPNSSNGQLEYTFAVSLLSDYTI